MSSSDLTSKISDRNVDEAIAPFLDVVADLALTGHHALETPLEPALGSVGMAALARQADFAGPWLSNPIDGISTQLDVTLRAAEESMNSFVALMRGPEPPVYAYYANVRMALECLSTVFHLAKPGLLVKERVRRHINLYIHELEQRIQLPTSLVDRKNVRRRAGELASAADALNESLTPKNRQKVQYIGSDSYRRTKLMAELFEDDELGRGRLL